MQLLDYLNRIYDTDDISDYSYGKIEPVPIDLSETEIEILELILDVIKLQEDYKAKEDIFKQFNSKRLPELQSITSEELAPLLSLNIEALPLAIRARVADFIWTTVKDYKCAKIAIESYLELYDLLWDEEHWTSCVEVLNRAVNIASRYNKKGKEYEACIQAIRDGLNRTQGKDRLFLSASLLEMLADHKCKIDDNVQQYARNAIEAAKHDSNLHKAQLVFDALVRLDPQNKEQYYEEAGDITQSLAYNPAIRRVTILNQALLYYQKAGAEEKKRLCRKQIEEAQKHVIEEMQLIRTDPIDISAQVRQVLEILNNSENIRQAIIKFGDLVHIYTREELLGFVRDGGVFASIFPSTRVDNKGRQIYSLPPLSLNEELSIDNKQIQLHMWDKARELQEINSNIILKYAYSKLNEVYDYTEEDLDFLVNENAIVPDGREEIIRKGLFTGLQGDLYAALHILIPQMEAIIRFLVEMCEGKTFHIKPDGNIENVLLGSLLETPELVDFYDPNILFCLKGLLDKKEGSNLRNNIAHGILEPGNTSIGLYFLGFMIKFLSWYSPICWEERQEMAKKSSKDRS